MRAATFTTPRTLATLAALGAGIALAGCGGSSHPGAAARAAVTPGGRQLSQLSTPGTPKGEQTVKIQVIATSSKPNREALALVPVRIDGHGPFPFALDTGASTSLISAPLARKLHLRDRGPGGLLSGVAGNARAEKVQVSSWRAGSVKLPPSVISAMAPASSTGGPGVLTNARGPVGLLGSDVLSRYGKIAIDYNHALLILDPAVR